VDYAEVRLTPWHGNGVDRVLYDGPVRGYDAVKTRRMPATGFYATTARQ
jgi:hypothetical protein